MSLHEAMVEEFESGSWVADLVADESFGGSFQLNDGSQWTGTKVSERNEILYKTRVIGGQGNLAKVVQDKFYSGNVSLQIAAGDICTEGGERLGSVTPGIFLTIYQRQKGTVAASLTRLADEFGLIWWIDRSGLVNMAKTRPSAAPANGNRAGIDTDASIVIKEPDGVVLGASYSSGDSTLSPIRHVRWHQTQNKFTAEIYPVPFIFRSPTVTVYDRVYNARVDKDNGDGTIDAIADARFGVQKVPFFCGVPHSKAKLSGGDQVVLAFFGGNPNAPFAFSAAQDATATKQVARNGDSVRITVSAADITALTLTCAAAPGPVVGTGGTLNGTITSGSDRLKVGD